jgi:hexosaminidase
MTDDQSFTFPSAAFPRLATKSHFAYTLADLKELKAFADLRGVTLLGEMDVPGHSTAMVDALPELFGFPSAPKLGVVNFANATVIARLQTLFDEIDAVFPSPYVAIGGDEVNFPAVEHLPEVVAALKEQNLAGVSDLYRRFIVQMHSYAVSKNKTLRVWEGFGPQGGQGGHKPVNASTVAVPTAGVSVSVFDGVYYNPPQLAADGYHIINANTATVYVNEPTATSKLIYQWHPWLFGDLAYAGYESWWELPQEGRHLVDGVQICDWGAPAEAMLDSFRVRAPAMSDRSWNPMAMRSFADYQKRQASTDQKLGMLLPAPPPPPPMPAAPKALAGFKVQIGACRDAAGSWTSPRIEAPRVHFSVLVAKCVALGGRCDAVDIAGRPIMPGQVPCTLFTVHESLPMNPLLTKILRNVTRTQAIAGARSGG